MKKKAFKAESKRLLDLMINSIYTHKEIFLREIISNASDAIDKLCYLSLTDDKVGLNRDQFEIKLSIDKERRLLTVSDNGIGMSQEELENNLGVIASSGSLKFRQQVEGDESADTDIIGQFGVGFYSAFMVASKVEVRSKKAGEEQGWLWSSEGSGSFTVKEEENVSRGTKITLYLKPDHYQYADAGEIRQIVRQFSDHISFPVIMHFMGETETVNMASALWTRNKAEITQEQYYDFYRHISHAFDDPWDILHYKAEGTIEYTALMFIPSKTPFDIFQPNRNAQIKLYINRVFITDQIADMLPNYLRFVKGIIDTKELPLNVSREMLQKTPVLAKIKTGVTRRILGELKKRSENKEDYEKFWDAFGIVLKEGLFEDASNRDDIAELCRFYSTNGEGLTSLADYVSRMKEGQEKIYYITADSYAAAKSSPHLELLRKKGIEVLLLSDRILKA